MKCPEPRHSKDIEPYWADADSYKNNGGSEDLGESLNLLERLVLANCKARRFAHHLSF